jgi:hypothetical protein
MAFTLGATPAETQEDGSGTADVTGSFTAGRNLVALVSWSHATVTLTSVVYDPGGGNEIALTAIGTALVTGVSTQKVHLFYLSNVPVTASETVRATWSAPLTGSGSLRVIEIIGGDTSNMLDAHNSATGNSAGPASTSVTTNTNNAAIFAIAASAAGELTQDSGYTVITILNPDRWAQGEYNLDVSTAGAKTVQMTHGGTAEWAIKAAAFKLASGAITPPVGSASLTGNAGRMNLGVPVPTTRRI